MIAFAVAALVVLPLLVLRRGTLVTYFAVDAATWLVAWLLWRRMPAFDPYLGAVVVAVLKLATFSLFLAVGTHVRWSANRAALIAAIVYAMTIPAMLRTPIDGDEPFYLLQTESLARDFDLDLSNQYRERAAAAWKRPDVVQPQTGDPRGENGEQYSRHEPFLAVLMLPGHLSGGLYGALATIALFGVLLVRSTIRWMEDEGIGDETTRAVFPLFAFAPPVLFYATRIWPEVPAAFFFVEALRGIREHRAKRWLPALLGLVLLKLRFVLVAVGIVAAGLLPVVRALRSRRSGTGSAQRPRAGFAIAIAIAVLALPLIVIALITGDPTNVHSWRELIPASPAAYAIGLGGLLADGMAGIAFQAPFYLFAGIALARWRSAPPGFRTGMLVSLLYVFYLAPRGEWFGGWAPPLRYLVFLMPVLALGIASVWDRISRGAIAIVSAWTIGLVIHGVAYPWRLFHEFNGENAAGEWLSRLYSSDFSRLFPSFIRLNDAAWWGVAAVVAFCAAAGFGGGSGRKAVAPLMIALAALALAAGFRFGTQPAETIHFEDAHVMRHGGTIYPEAYTLMRATYQGGWTLNAGDSLSFLAREGPHTLHFITGLGATMELDGATYSVKPDVRYQALDVHVPRTGRVTLKAVAGAINIDRLERR